MNGMLSERTRPQAPLSLLIPGARVMFVQAGQSSPGTLVALPRSPSEGPHLQLSRNSSVHPEDPWNGHMTGQGMQPPMQHNASNMLMQYSDMNAPMHVPMSGAMAGQGVSYGQGMQAPMQHNASNMLMQELMQMQQHSAIHAPTSGAMTGQGASYVQGMPAPMQHNASNMLMQELMHLPTSGAMYYQEAPGATAGLASTSSGEALDNFMCFFDQDKLERLRLMPKDAGKVNTSLFAFMHVLQSGPCGDCLLTLLTCACVHVLQIREATMAYMQQAPSYPGKSTILLHKFIDGYISGTSKANKQIIMDSEEEEHYAQTALFYSLCQASLVHYGPGRVMDAHVPCCAAMCVERHIIKVTTNRRACVYLCDVECSK